jgi:hypothetical protein
MGVVIDAELVRHGQEQRIGLFDCLVGPEVVHEPVRLRGVRAAEDRAHVVDDADLVVVLASPEIGAVAVVDDCEDRAGDRDSRLADMPGFLPGFPVAADLPGLLDVKGLARLILL